jgi:tRNA(Glu) U13 pseudouridine synthase TruD
MDELEVFGFLTDCKDDNVAKYYEEILTKEGIKREDFLIKQLKKISMEGTKRKLYLDINNFSYIWESDEMFPGKNKCTLTFELGKGSYATVLIDYLFY